MPGYSLPPCRSWMDKNSAFGYARHMAEADLRHRDRRGEWLPDPLPAPSALFSWPLRLWPALRSVVAFYWPYNIFYTVLAVVCWLWFTPDLSRTGSFAVGWIAELYARNAVLIIVLYGTVHLRLYIQRAQDDRHKFSNRWPSTDNRTFTFRSQTRDNMFWTLVSGGLIWTAYEAVTLWLYANGVLPMIAFSASPVYFVLLMLAIPLLRNFHFYWVHRLTHWKPLYKSAHYLHHKNVNPGPWSGLSMHPIEHLLYFSGVLLHWVIPSHPLHAIFHLMHAGVSPVPGHTGFFKIEVGDEHEIKNGGYFHYLHHKYFDCNYGGEIIPLDKWFGSFFDGSPESEVEMRARRRRLKGMAT